LKDPNAALHEKPEGEEDKDYDKDAPENKFFDKNMKSNTFRKPGN